MHTSLQIGENVSPEASSYINFRTLVRSTMKHLILQNSLNFLLTQGAIKCCNLRIPGRKETPFPSPLQWEGGGHVCAAAQPVHGRGCPGEHLEGYSAGCFSLYSLPTLARESLPMGNLSLLPRFLGVLPPRERGAPWVFPPCSTTHRGHLDPLRLPQRGGERGKIPKEGVHLPQVRASFW